MDERNKKQNYVSCFSRNNLCWLCGRCGNGVVGYGIGCISHNTQRTVKHHKKVTANSVKLSWDKVNGADYYEVQLYNKSTGKYETVKKVKSGYCNITGLKSGTEYKVKIWTIDKVNGKNKRQKSKVIKFTTSKQSNLSLSKTSLSIEEGKTAALTAKGTNGEKVEWSINNKTIATLTVNDNKVTINALKEGKTVINAKCGSKTAKCILTVTPNDESVSEKKWKDCITYYQFGKRYNLSNGCTLYIKSDFSSLEISMKNNARLFGCSNSTSIDYADYEISATLLQTSSDVYFEVSGTVDVTEPYQILVRNGYSSAYKFVSDCSFNGNETLKKSAFSKYYTHYTWETSSYDYGYGNYKDKVEDNLDKDATAMLIGALEHISADTGITAKELGFTYF